MALVIRMPEVLTGMAEAIVLAWHVSPGQEVAVGQAIAEIETEKAAVDYEAEQAGTVAGFLVELGTPVTVGTPMLVLAVAGETAEQALAEFSGGPGASGTSGTSGDGEGDSPAETATAPAEASAARADAQHKESTENSVPVAELPSRERLFASPLVRRLARDRKVDLTTVVGTGPGGRIVRRDLDRFQADEAQQPVAPPLTQPAAPAVRPEAVPSPATGEATRPVPHHADDGEFTDVPHTGMRRAIARRLTESKSTVPHFYMDIDCRVDSLLELRRTMKADNGPDTPTPSVNDFVVKAVAGALRDVPEANAIWTPDAIRRFTSVSIAVAVAIDGGLVTPVVRNVDTRSIGDIGRTVADLAGRAREGRLSQSDLEGGSFTVSNLGMYGIERFGAIINPPHAGILAVGAARRRAVVDDDGGITSATIMTVTLSGDHRVLDGALAAQWLGAFKERIEHPMRILL
ncbi:dihydrolipoamide acetyltransferase family protein [Streptomyces sp. NPDC059076]|uniref:dihydrolipoamide acetyltransferase family protein n=1 Tax=unclassified Streptomyces TaxID=2593676 RepID=UPI003686DF42